MASFPRLNFPPCSFRIRRREEGAQLWDPLRKQWLALTPEEWVRQHMLRYLVAQRGVAPLHIVQEYPVALGGQAQRADIVVVDKTGAPCLLVECKAPEVALNRQVFSQAVRYNSAVGAPYVALTNGMQLLCCVLDRANRRYDSLPELPDFSDYF